MYNSRKSMFIPPEFGNKEIQPLSLGTNFDYAAGYPQGFFITGEFYLILKLCFDPIVEDVNVYIIHFNEEKGVLENG